MAEVAKYRRFIDVAGGGVTISGGEPLLQPEFTGEMLRRSRDLGLHTALDTSGYLGDRATNELLADTDLVLLDIKSADPVGYRALTGVDLAPTLRFARRLSDLGRPVWIRFVLVPGLTDAVREVDVLAAFVSTLRNVERVGRCLPFHRMAMGKYRRAGPGVPARGRAPPTPGTARPGPSASSQTTASASSSAVLTGRRSCDRPCPLALTTTGGSAYREGNQEVMRRMP